MKLDQKGSGELDQLDQTGSDGVKLDHTGSNCIKLDQIGLSWIRLDQIGSTWFKWDKNGYKLVQIELTIKFGILLKLCQKNKIVSNWIQLDRLGLIASNWIKSLTLAGLP
jgi:hypothetical protein